MAKKVKTGLIGQILMIIIPVVSILFLVSTILFAVDWFQYREPVMWMYMIGVLVIAFAGLYYGWKIARLPGIGGKVAYIMCAAIIVTGIVFPPLYLLY